MANPADTKYDHHTHEIILFEYDLFDIALSSNDDLQMVEDVGGAGGGPSDVDITITAGTYSGDALALELKTQLDANTVEGYVYDVWYDTYQHHFFFRNTTNAETIQIDVSDSTAATILGFSGDPAASTQIESDKSAKPNNGLYIATEAITAGSGNDFDTNGPNKNYTDEFEALTGLGDITKSVDETGGFASATFGTLTLLNQDDTAPRSDFLADYPNIQNDPVNVIVIFDDGTDLVYSERTCIFSGSLDSPGFNENDFIMPINDNKLRTDKLIPLTEINENDYPQADDAIYGKPSQLVYGDFQDSNYVDTTPAPDMLKVWRGERMPAMPSIGLIVVGDAKFLFAEHVLFLLPADLSMYWLANYSAFAQVINGTVVNTAGEASLNWQNTSFDMLMNIRLRPTQRHEDDPGDIADYSNAIDDSDSTVVTVGNSEGLKLRLKDGSIPGNIEDIVVTDWGVTFVFGDIVGVGTAIASKNLAGVGENLKRVGGAGATITIADDNTTVSFDATGGTLETAWNDLVLWGFGINNDASISVEIKDMYIFIDNVKLSIVQQTARPGGEERISWKVNASQTEFAKNEDF